MVHAIAEEAAASPKWVQKEFGQSKLVLHTGAKEVTWEDVENTETPEATEKWQPIPHVRFVRTVEEAVTNSGLRIMQSNHTLTRGGQRYFGLLGVRNERRQEDEKDYQWALGLRNSHDKSFAASLVAGLRVFACDNLAFSGDVMIERMHTKRILDDLPKLTAAVMGKLVEEWNTTDANIERWRSIEIENPQAHDAIIRAFESGAITQKQIPAVLSAWKHPEHAEFRPRTVWSLHNAFTGVIGKGAPLDLVNHRTQRLNGLLSAY